MKISVNKYEILLTLILLFVPINLLKDLFPIPLTLITGGVILILMLSILIKKLSKKQFLWLIIPIILSVINCLNADDISRHIRYFFNWYALLCTLILCSNQSHILNFRDVYLKNEKSIHKMIRLVGIVIVILLCTPAAYSGGWWGLSNGFTAFTVSHAVAASACTFFTFELIYLQKHRKRKDFVEGVIILAIVLYVVFQSGARAYVVSLLAICSIYIFDIIKSPKIRIAVTIAGILFIAIIWSNSAFVEKMNIVASYQTSNGSSFVDAMSSGRSVIWETDFKHYLVSNPLVILFGKGFAYSYEINREFYYGMDIFSHNIFLETLLSTGVVGFFILISTMKGIFKLCKKDKIAKASLFIYVVVVGFINGLFDSQIYCYSIILLCVSILNKDVLDNEIWARNPARLTSVRAGRF